MEDEHQLVQHNFTHTPKRTLVQETPFQRFQRENKEKSTPRSVNPFEVKADSLYFPSCSPSVFATFAKNKKDNGEFRWSIDHISFLYPADIDETSNPDDKLDPEQEMKIQKAIDSYFSQNSIVPSPWSSDSDSKGRREIKFRRGIRNYANSTKSNDVSTQTMVSIPPQVDLLALLGTEYLFNDESASESLLSSSSNSNNSSYRESDVLSTSSLRRKLFTNEACHTPKLERKDLALAKQWTTPKSVRSIESTPSDLLSSSPITPPNCSESIVLSPLPLSPIAAPNKGLCSLSFNQRLEVEMDEPAKVESESLMSFCVDSQDNGTTFPSQDTGYVTGSMFSLQNVTSDVANVFSKVAPPSDDDCGMSISIMSCTEESISVDCHSNHFFKGNDVRPVSSSDAKWCLDIMPNNCSTPTVNL